jgi:hypothetical protein
LKLKNTLSEGGEMESTINNEKNCDLKSQVSSILLASNDFLSTKGYEIDFEHIEEFSERLSNVLSWLSCKCGVKKFKIELGVFFDNYNEFTINRWFEIKNSQIKSLWGGINIIKFDFDQRLCGIDIGRGIFIIDVSFSEKFSDSWFNLESSLERSKTLSEIEKFIRTHFFISYMSVNPGGVHFEIPVKFDVFKYII